MIESDAERLVFLNAKEFAKVASTDRGPIQGLFDAQYVGVDQVDEVAPMLLVRTSDATAVEARRGSPITVDGKTYRVRRVEPDGTGMARLILEE